MIYSYLQIYLLHIRPRFAAAGEEALFVKDDGKAFRPGTIGKRVGRFFQLAGIRKDVKVSATSICKMISDKAYELSPTKKRLIRGHMKHNERKADSNYVIRLNAERASKAHQLMQNIISETTPAQASAGPSVQPDDVPLETQTKQVPAEDDDPEENDDVPSSSLRKRRKLAMISSDESESEATETASVSSLNAEHKSVLLTVFQEVISKGKLLTMAEVSAKMCGDTFLRSMVTKPDLVKKIADFVRHKTNHTWHMQLTDLSELENGDFVASLGIESACRKTWNEHDNAVIESKFESLPHVKNKKEILKVFSSDPVLAHILEREGTHRCYEKVKNILWRKRS